MYTVDDNYSNNVDEDFDQYDDEIIEEKSWNNGTGLIVKIIIIILCIIVLIWLIKALKNNNSTKVVGANHDENVLKVRLAAEEFYFLRNKKDVYKVINLQQLKSYGLIDDVIDSNGNTCSNNSKISLEKGSTSYKMTINLDCSTKDEEEIYYYHLSNLACQNCNGKTIMTGHTIKEEEKGEVEDDNNDIPDDNGKQREYSCIAWSDWQEDKIEDPTLIEKTKTLVQGVKYGKSDIKVEYGDWSEYTKTPLHKDANLEVETKVETEEAWSDSKTAYDLDTSNPNIRIIDTSTETYGGGYYCPSGYSLSGSTCVSNSTSYGDLTYSQFNSGSYRVTNGLCGGVKNIRNSSGKYEITYINCSYNTTTSPRYSSSSRTVYTYQELTSTDVTYYRSRTVKPISIKEDDVYTDKKYEEKDLPSGYVKVPGTEETYYSYMLSSCEK